ncbi:tetratricopeptide repeat-containing serine protease family protein [Laspinema sp. A4]|uniref:tetratricopeptide repeat-containing S1 family peptidase n=1 Tax=Laspinema sp. D2d TaxID=2953686 RepID=UPI0021BB95F3|nr:tetratricopeptide repeat-containing serine protease family protein [Laspinema sp. D2d]MCT7985518.1 tetratricopeptide repeat-containing serine protease family protein [Laspinema sp. D2d]
MKVYHVFLAVLVGVAIALAQPYLGAAFMSDRVDQVKAIAQEITVLIPETDPQSGKTANGSGFLIARQGNTYTVLTANHVVCKNQSEPCNDPRPGLKVVTHDGREHRLNFNTVKKLPQVDLAILKFESNGNYKLATLGNYDTDHNSEREVQLPNGQIIREYGHFVFASGWPGINPPNISELKYRFSVGRLLPENRMVGFRIRPPEEGYQAVYTSITYPGMSGGPVLDTEGRVIAVHGQNEGTRVSNEGSSGRQPVLIGYSLSIPIAEFLNLAPQASIPLNNITVQTNPPQALNQDDIDAIGTEFVFAGMQEQNAAQPNSAVYWANQGNQYWRALRTEEALGAYEKAIAIDSEFYPVWYGKGLVKTFQEKYDEAFASYNQAITILDKQIAEFPRETERKERREWVVKLRDQIQPLMANSSPPTIPRDNSPAPQTQPNSTVQPSPPSPPPTAPLSTPEPQPETQPETQPGWLW